MSQEEMNSLTLEDICSYLRIFPMRCAEHNAFSQKTPAPFGVQEFSSIS